MKKPIIKLTILCLLILASCQELEEDGNNGTPGTPDYTLSVDGKLNCILLNSSVATSTAISAGTYSVAVSGDAFFAPSASHKRVLIRYSGSDDDHLQILSIGSSKSLGFRSGKLYAFFADWQSIDDNSGSVNISFDGTTLPVHGKDNCVLLNSSVAASVNIPEGVYKVKVTGNAFFSPGATHYDVFIRYAGSLDDELDILSIGGEKTLSLRNGDKFYAFFADWDNVSDNSGTVKIEFYKQ